MRQIQDDIRDVRVPSEALARWALETAVAAQEATCAALGFLVAKAKIPAFKSDTAVQVGKTFRFE